MTPTEATGPGTLTDAIYRASLDPARLALITGGPAGVPYAWLTNTNWIHYDPVASPKQAAALLVAAQLSGLPIDLDLMMRGWPAAIMQVRQNDGYAYVPPYGSPDVNVGPGLPPPTGEVNNYPATMPAGWILVSTDAKDYPVYVPPVVVTVPTVWTPVMNEMLSALDPSTGLVRYYFGITGGQNPALGTACTFEGLSFVAALYPGGNQELMGGGAPMKLWLLVPAPAPAPGGVAS